MHARAYTQTHTHTYIYVCMHVSMYVCILANGILQDMIELYYVGDNRTYFTTLFKYDWFDSINGVSVHETYKLVNVNHKKRCRKYDPFVLVIKPSDSSLFYARKWEKRLMAVVENEVKAYNTCYGRRTLIPSA